MKIIMQLNIPEGSDFEKKMERMRELRKEMEDIARSLSFCFEMAEMSAAETNGEAKNPPLRAD